MTGTLVLGLVSSNPAMAGSDVYAAPEPLPKGKPGTIIMSEPIAAPVGAQAWRVLYKSKSVEGAQVAVSGVIVAPEGKAPKGGRPVVAWAHGTTGIADACAPSKRDDIASALPFVDEVVASGYVVAATDYEGLGTPGVHPYLVGASEGAGVLDAARAARNLRGAGAGRDVVVWGHSQGGHAALFAGEMAGEYAPELTLDGVIAGAPAAEIGRTIPLAAQLPRAAGFYALAAKGLLAAYPEDVDEASLFTPEALEAAKVADDACVVDVIQQLSTFPGSLAPGDISQDEAIVDLFARSSAGDRPAGAPVLVVQGTTDAIVTKGSTDRFVEKACVLGDVVDYVTYEGAGHVDVVPTAKPDILAWIAARFAGDAARNTCPT
jgi:alpha-beta hydrolase superfamily lysophospholipase